MALLEKSEIGELEQAKDWLEGCSSQTVSKVITDQYNGTHMCNTSAKHAWLLIGAREGWIKEQGE